MGTTTLVIVGALVVMLAFVLGRRLSPARKQAEAIQKELDQTQEQLELVRRQVDGHFKESARLFGSLALDYRALYDHFSDTARQLGYTARETQSLLAEADQQLLTGGRIEAEKPHTPPQPGKEEHPPEARHEPPEHSDEKELQAREASA